MAILIRNVTGADVLALRQTVTEHGPISKEDLVDRYFPDDATDPKLSDQRKPIEDAIEFLVETDQIVESSNGYEITEKASSFDDARLALLHGIRTQEGEDAAYNEVLECLADRRKPLADRNGELLDELNDRAPARNWNEQKLRYWARVMEELGVTKEVNGDRTTTMMGPSRDLALRLISDVADEGTNALETVLPQLDERYLPVMGDGLEVATYFQRTLVALEATNDIRLRTVSDIGQSVVIDGTRYSAIEVMTNE